MSTSLQTIVIGGVELPLWVFVDGFTQDYEEITGVGELVMDDGSLTISRLDQGRNYRLRTTISGGGTLIAPLDALDRGAEVEIQCAEPRRISHPTIPTSLSITLPAGRRTGGIYTPRGYAMMAIGEIVETPITSIVDNVATLVAVTGAMHYHVLYYPKFTGRIEHKHSSEPWQAKRTWTITVREA